MTTMRLRIRNGILLAILTLPIVGACRTADSHAPPQFVSSHWRTVSALPNYLITYPDENEARQIAEGILRKAADRDAVHALEYSQMAQALHNAKFVRDGSDVVRNCRPQLTDVSNSAASDGVQAASAIAFAKLKIMKHDGKIHVGADTIGICPNAEGVMPSTLIHEAWHMKFGAGESEAEMAAAQAIYSGAAGNHYLFYVYDVSNGEETGPATYQSTYLCRFQAVEDFQIRIDSKHESTIRENCGH